MRRRLVDQVWIEELTLTNHLHENQPAACRVGSRQRFSPTSFEVKDGGGWPTDTSPARMANGSLTLA